MAYQIMLVDDDAEFREEFQECLYEFDVVTAGSAQEALAVLSRPNHIDVAILDVMLPSMSGTDLLREIRKTHPKLGIVILTGHGSKDVAIEALKADADDYLEKPVNIDKTKDVINRLIKTSGAVALESGSSTERKIAWVKEYIERNFDKKVNLKQAAESVSLSPKYLSRVFEQFAGESFNQYKIRVKSEKAKEWLVDKGWTVDQISYKLGYEKSESFIRMFKKMTGQTPHVYRKSHQTV